jgi:hypothetical protein
MNECFAIDPNAPQDKKDLATLAHTFGPGNGRFIAEYPSDWLSYAQSSLDGFSGLDRSRAQLLLTKLRDSLVPVKAPFSRGRSWEANAANLVKQRYGIKEILGKDPNAAGLMTLSQYLWDTPESLVGTSAGDHIPMTAECYRDACWPLFVFSTEVHLADRFFALRNRIGQTDKTRVPILQILLQTAVFFNRTKLIHIHFERNFDYSESEQEQQIEDDLTAIMDGTGITNLDVVYSLREELKHGRYLFSIKGGLHFDHGFQLLRNQKNHVHWLKPEELKPLHAFYEI